MKVQKEPMFLFLTAQQHLAHCCVSCVYTGTRLSCLTAQYLAHYVGKHYVWYVTELMSISEPDHRDHVVPGKAITVHSDD
jgi:hypothetical protein